MAKQKNIPKLRFPGFNDEWGRKRFGNIATNKSDKYNPENEKQSFNCIELEHLASETGQLLGYIDSKQSASIKNKFKKGDVLYGKLRPYLKKFLIAPFNGVCSSEIWVLKGIAIKNEFLYGLIQTDSFIDLANQTSGSKMPRSDWNVIENGQFLIPSLPEQQKIASFLTVVDEKIQALKKKKELLERYKKGVMQQIFSQKIRFKDEGGKAFPDWEEKRLGDILIKNSIKNKSNSYDLVQSVSNRYGFINQTDYFEDRIVASKDTSNYYVISKGHFAYNPSRINVGSLAYKNDNQISIISPLYISFKSKNEFLNDWFLLNWFYCEPFIKQMNNSFEGSVRNTLSYESLVKMNIQIPCLKEQTKIANFLSAIDEKINTVQLQTEQTELWKKGLLQQMFV